MRPLRDTAFFLTVVTIGQLGYAGCSDEWLSCRTEAREFRKECVSTCEDSTCRRDCADTLKSDYADCDAGKSECLESTPSQSSSQLPSYQAPQFNSPASICATNFGPCPMRVPVPVGASCYCATPAGQIWGIAQ